MSVVDIYSRRKRRAERGEPDVYQYDHVPDELRIQVRHILNSALGRWFTPSPSYFQSTVSENNHLIRALHDQLLREKAQRFLFDERADPKRDILDAVSSGLPNMDDWLDVVELCFFYIHRMRVLRNGERKDRGITQDPENAIEELNSRFRHAGFGYRIEEGRSFGLTRSCFTPRS